jgi:hypothetical protein
MTDLIVVLGHFLGVLHLQWTERQSPTEVLLEFVLIWLQVQYKV